METYTQTLAADYDSDIHADRSFASVLFTKFSGGTVSLKLMFVINGLLSAALLAYSVFSAKGEKIEVN